MLKAPKPAAGPSPSTPDDARPFGLAAPVRPSELVVGPASVRAPAPFLSSAPESVASPPLSVRSLAVCKTAALVPESIVTGCAEEAAAPV